MNVAHFSFEFFLLLSVALVWIQCDLFVRVSIPFPLFNSTKHFYFCFYCHFRSFCHNNIICSEKIIYLVLCELSFIFTTNNHMYLFWVLNIEILISTFFREISFLWLSLIFLWKYVFIQYYIIFNISFTCMLFCECFFHSDICFQLYSY